MGGGGGDDEKGERGWIGWREGDEGEGWMNLDGDVLGLVCAEGNLWGPSPYPWTWSPDEWVVVVWWTVAVGGPSRRGWAGRRLRNHRDCIYGLVI